MKASARCSVVLVTLGLVARPAYALGDQINVFIYGALAAIGLAVVVVLGWLIHAIVTSPARRNELLVGALIFGLLLLLWVTL